MKKRITILILAISVSTFAQTGIGTTTPNTNAQLEVASTTKGFLPPRVALTSTTSASPLSAHVAGMVVYNTATAGDVTPGLYVDSGTAWEKQIGATSIIGEIKQTIASSMPSGWVKLDGTAISSLTGTQQTQATTLGLSVNLPNATNAYLSQNGGVLGSVSGSNSKTIAQNNLPNVILSGTTNSAGSHTHIPTGTYTKASRVTGFNTVVYIDNTPNEVDLLSAGTITLNTAGAHTHTVTTSPINGGVTQQAMDITPTTLSVNTYIYLGL